MNKEEYRQFIIKMLQCIENERDLKQIYTIVHRKFINRYPETKEETIA